MHARCHDRETLPSGDSSTYRPPFLEAPRYPYGQFEIMIGIYVIKGLSMTCGPDIRPHDPSHFKASRRADGPFYHNRRLASRVSVWPWHDDVPVFSFAFATSPFCLATSASWRLPSLVTLRLESNADVDMLESIRGRMPPATDGGNDRTNL